MTEEIDPDVQRALDAHRTKPSNKRKARIRQVIKDYKAAGNWDKMDAIFVFDEADNEHDAQINVKNPPKGAKE